MEKNILVTGGAGYIGSHTVKILVGKGYNVVVLDNLSYGHKNAVDKRAKFVKADLSDKEKIKKALKENKINAVIHFAGFIQVGESVKKPDKYFRNNFVNGLNLLDAMKETGCKNIVFSSSAAVYGEPKKVPIKEDDETRPGNPYGFTKRMFEAILKCYDDAYGIKSVALRYFNAAGADFSGEIGEDHNPETHLIPNILDAALGKSREIKVFGSDYNTKDGTCVRDYVHVVDLAEAHVLAVESLFNGKGSKVYNLGNGKGYSVNEIIETVRKVTGKEINILYAERRQGDAAALIADYGKIRKELGWEPKYGIKKIIESAWKWHRRRFIVDR